MNKEAFIASLADQGVEFLVSHAAPYGQSSVAIPAQEVVLFSADPVAYLASHYGVTQRQYLAWHQSEYNVFCSGYTRENQPCKRVITGGNAIDSPKQWVELQGGYCPSHGE